MDNKSVSRITFGLLIFMALLVAGFHFNARGITFLAATSLRPLIWCGIVLAVVILIFNDRYLSALQLLIAALLYAILPFTLYFNESKDAHFVVLRHRDIACGFWAVASIALTLWIGRYRKISSL